MPGVPVNLTRRDWLVALEQSLLVLIIIGRWLIPKGKLLSQSFVFYFEMIDLTPQMY